MADRDVILRLGTKTQGDLGKPMKELARDAREAGRAVDEADGKLRRASGGGAGSAAGQVAGRFGFGGVGGGGGAAGAAVAALAVINRIPELLQKGGPFGRGAFDQGRFSRDALKDSLIFKSGELPLVGNLLKLSNEYERLEERVRRVQEAEEALHRTEQRIALSREFVARRQALGDELARAEARLKYGSSSAGAQFALGTAGQRLTERLQAGPVPFGRDRATAQADVAASVAFETRLRQQQVEQGRQLKLQDADRERSAQVVAQKQRELFEARKQTEAQQRNLAAALGGNNGYVSAGDGFLSGFGRTVTFGQAGGGKAGFAQDQIDERRLHVREALAAQAEAERQLEEALNRQKELSAARGDTLLEQQRERLGLMEQERDRLTAIVRQERERLQAGREQFGLQNPQTKWTLLQLSRKINAGQDLTEREIQYAQTKGGDLFRPALAEQGRRRAGPEYDELVRNLGGDRRLGEAEQARVALESKITIEIKKNEQAVSDVVAKEVIPEIHNLFYELERRFTRALEQLKLDIANQRRPGAQG